jgi:hypothetical protein
MSFANLRTTARSNKVKQKGKFHSVTFSIYGISRGGMSWQFSRNCLANHSTCEWELLELQRNISVFTLFGGLFFKKYPNIKARDIIPDFLKGEVKKKTLQKPTQNGCFV